MFVNVFNSFCSFVFKVNLIVPLPVPLNLQTVLKNYLNLITAHTSKVSKRYRVLKLLRVLLLIIELEAVFL